MMFSESIIIEDFKDYNYAHKNNRIITMPHNMYHQEQNKTLSMADLLRLNNVNSAAPTSIPPPSDPNVVRENEAMLMNQMRDNSATSGALGQISDAEMGTMAGAMGTMGAMGNLGGMATESPYSPTALSEEDRMLLDQMMRNQAMYGTM